MKEKDESSPADPQQARTERPGRRTCGSMHENVPVWSDPCCCCEPEPYWVEVAEELGIDLSDTGCNG